MEAGESLGSILDYETSFVDAGASVAVSASMAGGYSAVELLREACVCQVDMVESTDRLPISKELFSASWV